MKKFAFVIIVFTWGILFAQNPFHQIRYYDTLSVDTSAVSDSLVLSDSLSNYMIGLDTAYLKSIQEVDTLQIAFMEGVNLFNTQKYFDALRVFERILEIPSYINHFYVASEMMIVKTYLRLGKYEETIEKGYEFETKYETSTYLDDVRYTIADALMSVGRHSDAILYYLNVMEITNSRKLLEKCRQSIDIVVDLFLTIEDLENLSRSVRNHYFFNFMLSLKIIEKNHFDGNILHEEENLGRARRQIRSDFFQEEFDRTVQKINFRSGGQNYIGVILPLSGNKADVVLGKKLLAGLKVSIHRFNQRSNKKISAIVMDNKGEIVTSVQYAQYLANNPRVLAIYGPVSSENVVAVATYASEKGIPVISPTATQSDITDLGAWVFQANVNLENLGEYLGKYCTSVNEHSTFATLAPIGDYGEKLTDSFSEAIDLNGGRIVSQQWYSGTPEQLKIQFNNIRQAGVDMATDRLARIIGEKRDSLYILSMQKGSDWNRDDCFLNITDSVCQLYQNGRIYEFSVPELMVYTGSMTEDEFKLPSVDSLDHKIRSIDGFFIPASTEDLKFILPQLKYYNFFTNIYGTRNLINSELLTLNRTAANGFYFISDYFIDDNSSKYRQVINDYLSITGEDPDRFGVYGFDTMEVLLMAYYNSNMTRKSIRDQLLNMPVYYGLGRNISFTGNQPGSNSCAFIVTYKRGQMTPVARVEKGYIIPAENQR
ncbi:MAG: penicillin-binding protein activator [Candidatus Marinimicrobia bacterium]|nr:penicillin-binding protein activator [Candidatus Neomarinimicrobiota bacterium]